MSRRPYRSRKRVFATTCMLAGGGILIAMVPILFDTGVGGNKLALLILLPIPAAFLILSAVLFRSAKKSEKDQPDMDDDNGEIPTREGAYHLTKEDGWQQNRALYGSHVHTSDRNMIKGTQMGYTYKTDDYRKVIPAYIIGTILVILLNVILLAVIPPFGILCAVFSMIWVIAIWKNAPFTKKNQRKQIQDEKTENDN